MSCRAWPRLNTSFVLRMLHSLSPVLPKLPRVVAFFSMKKLRLRKKWSHLGELELEPKSLWSKAWTLFTTAYSLLHFTQVIWDFNLAMSPFWGCYHFPIPNCSELQWTISKLPVPALGSAQKMPFIIWLAKEPQVPCAMVGTKWPGSFI